MKKKDESKYVMPSALALVASVAAAVDGRWDCAHVQIDGNKATATDGRVAIIVTTDEPMVEADKRFPDVGAVIPKGKPMIRILIDPGRMAKIMLAAKEVHDECCWLEIHGQDKPLVIRADSLFGEREDRKVELVAMLMPFTLSGNTQEVDK